MGNLIGIFVVLCVVAHFTTKKVDSARVKKWFDEEMNK